MTIPVLLAVTKKYPKLKLTVVSKKFHGPIFEDLHNIDFFAAELTTKHRGFFGLFRLYKELKHLKIVALADLHNVLRSKVLGVFFRLRATRVVQIDKGRSEKRALTRIRNRNLVPLKTTHERYAEVFGRLGFPVDLTKNDILKKQILTENVLRITGNDALKWIGIAPFAAHTGKMYGLEKMETVISKLSNTSQYKIFLFGGGQQEKAWVEAVAGSFDHVVAVPGKLNFVEELQLISNLDVMVSMDSANGHLAANYGVPVITLWGVTHPYAGFYPYNQPSENWLLSNRDKFPLIPTSIYGNKTPTGYDTVMDTITEHNVVAKIEQVLSRL
ncbi:MAG: lipopolysaccharide heptosyltransferase family protein [Allomuricauda sp.]|nr:MAG: lipopolysaccharide heptosyltransferase family protein [Allomuricauda sp.]